MTSSHILMQSRAGHSCLTATAILLAISTSISLAFAQQGAPDDATPSSEPAAKIPVDRWAPKGPLPLWRRALPGDRSAIVADRLNAYTMHHENNADVVVAVGDLTGTTKWAHRYSTPVANHISTTSGDHAGTTLLVAGKHLISIGYAGYTHCFNTYTGEIVWSRNLAGDFPGTARPHGYSEIGAIHRDSVIAVIGSAEHGVVSLEVADGSVRWKSEPFETRYASPILMNIGDQTHVVFLTAREIVGLDADTGRTLWRHPHVTDEGTQRASLMGWPDGLLYVGSIGDGGRALRVTSKNDRTEHHELWHDQKIRFYFASIIRMGNYLYGSLAGQSSSFFAAIDIRDGGIAWRDDAFPEASCFLHDNAVVIYDKAGLLTSAGLSPKGLTVYSQVLLAAPHTWARAALVNAKLFIRNSNSMGAYTLNIAH